MQETKKERPMMAIKCELEDNDFHGRPKKSQRLGAGEAIRVGLQVVLEGGETNRHAHEGEDACWVVLEGKARFYGKTDADIYEAGPHEAILIPMGHPYWFESVGKVPLKVLRVSARDKRIGNERLDFEDRRAWQQEQMQGRRAEMPS